MRNLLSLKVSSVNNEIPYYGVSCCYFYLIREFCHVRDTFGQIPDFRKVLIILNGIFQN